MNLKHKEGDIEVVVIAPEPSLIVRPRLYKANASAMAHPLGTLFESAGIKFIQDTVEAIHPDEHTVDARSASGVASTVNYHRLILAAGSALVRPPKITGLQQYDFDVDSLQAAIRLESHLEHLASLPPGPGTFVVCGGGFTGIELATELPGRFSKGDIRVILVEYADEVGPELGPGPRPVIMKALKDIGVEAYVAENR